MYVLPKLFRILHTLSLEFHRSQDRTSHFDAMAELQSYKIATINMNGISSEAKLAALASFIRSSEADVVFLQEVAVADLQLHGFNIVVNIDERRRGTAIAVRTYFEYNNVRRSLDSRIISLRCNDTTFINVYAPPGSQNRGTREHFFNCILPHYLQNATGFVVLGGDLNSVVNQKDATGINSHSPMFRKLMQAGDLRDSWEILHRERVEFSFIRADSASRIDRILVSSNISSHVRTAHFTSTPFSDHKAYVVRMVLPALGTSPGRGIWRFYADLLDDARVVEELGIKWRYWTGLRRNYPSWIAWWMNFLKPKLISFLKWKTAQKNRIFYDTTEMYYAMLNNAYSTYHGNRNQLRTINHLKALMLSHQRNHVKERRQRNEVYIGGENTSIFHIANGKTRRSETTIRKLEMENGLLEDPNDIQRAVHGFFENLYTDTNSIVDDSFNPVRTLPEDNQLNLSIMGQISSDEVLQAVKCSASRKSPGVDGLPKEFFLRAWNIIQREFTLVINDVLTGIAPKEFFDGIIVLVRKKGGGDNIKSYRPISLLNVDYKLFARIIKQRMTPLLPLVLSGRQKCSNGRRNIFEATARILDRLCELNEHRRSSLLVAFDFDHAFDRVDHKFLKNTMQKMNFNGGLIDLLMDCYGKSHSRVLVNGKLTREIKIRRSVRQGDPLSMILFVIHLQPLLDKLSELFPEAILNAYADDLSMFIENEQQLCAVLEVITDFGRVSGSLLNKSKSNALVVGMVPLSAEAEWLHVGNAVSILGVTFAENMSDTVEQNWSKVLRGFQIRLWMNNTRNLNLIQKVILINTYISSKLWYLASILPLPNKYAGKFISRIGSFLWYGKPWTRIAFETLVLPKKRGGLNLHSPAIKAKALLVNRTMSMAAELPFMWSFLEQNANPPNIGVIPRKFEHIRIVARETVFLPEMVTEAASSDAIYQFYLSRLKDPKFVRENPGRNWKKVFGNLHSKSLTSDQRSTWFGVMHRKIETNEMMFNRGRRNNPECDRCPGEVDTVVHHLFKCGVNRQIWTYLRNNFISIDRRVIALDAEEWLYPVLHNINRRTRQHFVKLLCIMIMYMIESHEDQRSVDEFKFYMNYNL